MILSKDDPGYHDLTAKEIITCQNLRLSPSQYLCMKKAMISGVHLASGPFLKKDAIKMFRLDVRKVNIKFITYQSYS